MNTVFRLVLKCDLAVSYLRFLPRFAWVQLQNVDLHFSTSY
jgi:hypothetical protein